MAEHDSQAAGATPGAELKRAREARGLSVHQLAVELHISDAMVNAMERGDYAVLGEPVFVRGHLRNYSRALGVPEAEILAAYDLTQNKPAPPTLMPIPHTAGLSPRAKEWSMRGATIVVVLVLLVMAVSWWLRRPEAPPEQQAVNTAPAAVSTAIPVTATQPMAALTDLADNAPMAQKPASKPAPVVPTPAPKTPAVTKPAATVPHPVLSVPSAPPGDLTHVKFTLGAASWVEVYDNNGKRIYYDLAPAGDNLELSGAGPLQVFLGNAPGVSIELEGAPFDLKPFQRTDNTARFKLGAPAKP